MFAAKYFQWQNDVLVKTIYPMREVKLRDFLAYYMEVDIWKQYKGKDIASLANEVAEYKKSKEAAAITAYKTYKYLRDYFLTPDVRAHYISFKPLDESEMAEINKLHALFAQSWPKDIRGERSFVEGQIQYWLNHRNMHRDWVRNRERRLEAMDRNHPKYQPELAELTQKKSVSLPMAEREIEQLRAFLATYDNIEKRKLDWFKKKQSDPNFAVSEAEYLIHFDPAQPVTVYDIAAWRAEEYKKSLEGKKQYELLGLIRQRFEKEPKRYPQWLQYMVVHFSGMRYASAHSSWADPKDLLIRLRAADAQKEVNKLDDETVARLCAEKIASYEAGTGPNRPKLAAAPEKEWKDKAATHLLSVKANGPKTRRAGLAALQAEELNYEMYSLSSDEALKKLEEMKHRFPAWAWKEIVKLTPLRTKYVTDFNWEKLSPEEEAQRNLPEHNDIRMIMDAWENFDATAWRDEHGRSHELIVTRAVCNETAEHIQHIRGHLPPGGLTPKPKWYLTNETENKIPGQPRPYYTKPVSGQDYQTGASILWLRFVDKEPNAWQIAKTVKTKAGIGLLPDHFGKPAKEDKKSKEDKNAAVIGPWEYQHGETITRTRTITNPDKTKVVQKQWLRWIHEATVAEVAETADGPIIITYETALPDDDKGVSAIGTFKMPLEWHLSDGTEDQYNRSFVGYIPEGQIPADHLKIMLDWNRILPPMSS